MEKVLFIIEKTATLMMAVFQTTKTIIEIIKLFK